jgi:hypothetical protein
MLEWEVMVLCFGFVVLKSGVVVFEGWSMILKR